MQRQGFGTSDKKPRNIDFFMEELKRESEERARREKERAERGEEYVPRRREGGKVSQGSLPGSSNLPGVFGWQECQESLPGR